MKKKNYVDTSKSALNIKKKRKLSSHTKKRGNRPQQQQQKIGATIFCSNLFSLTEWDIEITQKARGANWCFLILFFSISFAEMLLI